MLMPKEITISSKLVAVVNGLEINRTEAKKVNAYDEPYGPARVYYDVQIDESWYEGFKTLREAKKFAKTYQQ